MCLSRAELLSQPFRRQLVGAAFFGWATWNVEVFNLSDFSSVRFNWNWPLDSKLESSDWQMYSNAWYDLLNFVLQGARLQTFSKLQSIKAASGGCSASLGQGCPAIVPCCLLVLLWSGWKYFFFFFSSWMTRPKAIVFIALSCSRWFRCPGNRLCNQNYWCSRPLPNPAYRGECRTGCKVLFPKQCLQAVSVWCCLTISNSVCWRSCVEVLSVSVRIPGNGSCAMSLVLCEHNATLVGAWQQQGQSRQLPCLLLWKGCPVLWLLILLWKQELLLPKQLNSFKEQPGSLLVGCALSDKGGCCCRHVTGGKRKEGFRKDQNF